MLINIIYGFFNRRMSYTDPKALVRYRFRRNQAMPPSHFLFLNNIFFPNMSLRCGYFSLFSEHLAVICHKMSATPYIYCISIHIFISNFTAMTESQALIVPGLCSLYSPPKTRRHLIF